jgi:hypothetical protein
MGGVAVTTERKQKVFEGLAVLYAAGADELCAEHDQIWVYGAKLSEEDALKLDTGGWFEDCGGWSRFV